MNHLEKLNRKRLGEILIDEGLISQTQLEDAERHRHATGEPLGYVLVDCSYLPEEDLARTVAAQYQLPYIELTTVPPSKDLEELIPIRDIVTQRLLPIARFGSVVTIAVAEMPDMAVMKDLRQRTGLTPFLCVGMLSDLDRNISALMEAKGLTRESGGRALTEARSAREELPAEDEEDGTITIEAPDFDEGDWQSLFDEANNEVLKELTD